MGITKDCFMHYETLVRNRISMSNKCKIVDIGNQTVHFDDNNFLRDWAHRNNISDDFVNRVYSGITAQELYELLGHDYTSINCDNFNGDNAATKIDLNTDYCPVELVNSADVTTNYGSTRNVLNQINAFQFIHDITRPWGAMIHVLPIARWNYSFINYNPVFFTSLAYANQYKIVTLGTSKDLWYNTMQDVIPYTGEHIPTHEYIHVILIKTSINKFKSPTHMYVNGRLI